MIRALAAGLVLLSGGAWAEGVAPDPLRIGTESDFAPYIFRDETGALSGIDSELGAELCRRGNFACEWIETPFADLLPGLAEGRFDIVIAGIGPTPERREFADFTAAYTPAGGTAAYAGLPDAPPPDRARIAVQEATLHEDHLIAQGMTVLPWPSNEDAFQAVERGEADLFFGSATYVEDRIATRASPLRALYTEELDSAGAAIAVARGAADLLTRLDAILAALEADGTLPVLRARWFQDAEPV